MDEDEFASHADRFAVAADETRLEILHGVAERALLEGPLTYSEAMAATDLDDSGHFNYHLDRLRGEFVYEFGDRYMPTTAALELLGAVSTGRLGDDDAGRPETTLGAACWHCGRAIVCRFRYEFLVLCPDCLYWLFSYSVGPDVAADADLRRLAREVEATFFDETRLLLERRCTRCGGATDASLATATGIHADRGLDVVAVVGCENCESVGGHLTVGQYLLSHPTVRDYCADRGIDLHARPHWEHHWARTDASTVVESTEPLRVAAYPTVDGCRLVVAVEADGSVSHVDHLPVDGRHED